MPSDQQSGETEHRASRRDEVSVEPRGFLDPAASSDEDYDSAARQGGADGSRTFGAMTGGIDDEDSSFGGYNTGRAA